MHRRSFLKGAGVVTVLVAGGGVWRAFDQGVFSAGAGPAYLPWENWRDGLTVDAFGLPPLMTGAAKMMPPWLLRRVAAKGAQSGYSDLMSSAPLIGVIAVHDRYDREQCLRAGRIWQRAHLLATARGLAGRPCNEAVEMIDHEKALGKQARRAGLLAEILKDTTWEPTFVFYMGYPALTARASPRRPVEKVLL
jgi:hypothetical protein